MHQLTLCPHISGSVKVGLCDLCVWALCSQETAVWIACIEALLVRLTLVLTQDRVEAEF